MQKINVNLDIIASSKKITKLLLKQSIYSHS